MWRPIGCNVGRSSLGICLVLALGMCKPPGSAAPDQGGGDLALPPTVVSALVSQNAGATLPSSFVGFSLDWSALPAQLGVPRTGANAALAQLLQNLIVGGHGLPLLRIGGDSQDRAWWNPTGAARPPGVTLDLTQDHLDALLGLNEVTNARFLLGLNLAANDPALSSNLVKALQAALPSSAVLGYEVGNEPDLYAQNGARSSTYAFGDYSTEVGSQMSALLPLFGSGSHPLALPAWAGLSWGADFSDLMGAYGNSVDLVTLHASPLNVCGKSATDSDYPKLHDLLADSASANLAAGYMAAITATLRAGRTLRIGSAVSARCGGATGVSNTFASALWAADLLFSFWSLGASGVLFDNSDTSAAAMKFIASTDENGMVSFTSQVLPLYYGLLLFAYAAGGKSQLLPTPTITDANIRVWATSDLQDFAGVPGPHIRALVINKDISASGTARLSVSSARARPATLLRLTAPSSDSQQGIQLGGQTFDGSPDGTLRGTLQTETVMPEGTFDYSFVLPAASAALLIVPIL